MCLKPSNRAPYVERTPSIGGALALPAIFLPVTASASTPHPAPGAAAIRLPSYFEANAGQARSDAGFLLRNARYDAEIGVAGFRIHVHGPGGTDSVGVRFGGAAA